jgi:hypothetical protein
MFRDGSLSSCGLEFLWFLVPKWTTLLGCGLRRSELLSVTVKTIQQRQAPLLGSPAKRISEKKL